MILQILKETMAACLGSAAFAVLFEISRVHWLPCSLIGAGGWFVYAMLSYNAICGKTISILCAALFITLISRAAAIRMKVPAIILLTAGLFPLVPGAGIFWTAYYAVLGNQAAAVSNGFTALKTAGAIALGICLMYQIPNSIIIKISRIKWLEKKQKNA